MKVPLNLQPAHRRVRQPTGWRGVELHPLRTVVERHVQRVLRARVQQAAPHRIFAHHVHVAEHTARNGGVEPRERAAVVGGLVDVRVAIVDEMRVYRHVRRRGVVLAGLDVGNGAPLGEPRQVGGNVAPALAAITREVHEAVHGARPDQILLHRRLGDGKQHRHVLHEQVVDHEPTTALLLGAVVGAQVGGDERPALPTVGGLVHVLRAHVHRVVVVRAHVNGERPLEAVLQILGAHTVSRLGPRLHGARHFGLQVEALEPRIVAAAPHRAPVDGVGNGPAAFAATHRAPHANAARAARIAGPTVRVPVLAIAIQVVRNLGIGGHVIHLRVGERDACEALAAVDGDAHAAVVTHHEAIGVAHIPPDVVQVAARARRVGHFGEATIECAHEAHTHEVHVVGVGRVHPKARVVLRALQQVMIAVYGAPRAATVVAAIERRLLHFDQRVHALRVVARHAQADLAHGARAWEPAPPPLTVGATIEACPRVATVARHVNAAARAARVLVPRHDVLLPARREEHTRVGGVHDHIDDARAVVHEQHLLPLFPAIGGAPQSTIGLRPVAVPLRRGVHRVGVGGVNEHPPNAPRVFEPHALPVRAGIGAAIDAIANGNITAQECFPRAEPHHVRVARRHRDGADAAYAQRVGNRCPADTTVGALEQPARGRARVVRLVLTRHARDGDDAVAIGPHEAPSGDFDEGGVEGRRRSGGCFGGGALGGERRRSDGEREEEGAEAHGCRGEGEGDQNMRPRR